MHNLSAPFPIYSRSFWWLPDRNSYKVDREGSSRRWCLRVSLMLNNISEYKRA
jgi:hypothetical protein